MSLATTESLPNLFREYRIPYAGQPSREANSERSAPRRTMKRRWSIAKRNRLARARSSRSSVCQYSVTGSLVASMSIQVTSTRPTTGMLLSCRGGRDRGQ